MEWSGRPVARSIADAIPRARAVLSGVICSLHVREIPETTILLEADLRDATGVISLSWAGRTSIPGMSPGASVTVEGTVSEHAGRRRLLNPLYRFTDAVKTER